MPVVDVFMDTTGFLALWDTGDEHEFKQNGFVPLLNI